jgi:hypothetical protein
MQVEFLVNGNEGVSILMAPENPMEEELIKQLLKQQNDITQIRTAVVVVNKTFRNGIFIGKKTLNLNQEPTTNTPDNESN